MKILHTSDLHIGKKLNGRDRYDEFRGVMREIADVCRRENVELALVAGDVFDSYTPSAEAEEIFYSGIKLIAQNSTVLIISGNHDDYVRLTAAASLAEELNVFIVGNNLQAVKCGKGGKAYPEKSGCGWVIFKNDGGERVYINTLPYPNEARFKEGKSDESYEEKISRWIAVGEQGKSETNGKIPSVFLSHVFVAGGAVSDSEREIDLGGTRLVPLNLLPDCDYCALGHLHKSQKLGGNAYYCGAPMQFTFDESGNKKYVNVFDLTDGGVQNFKQVEILSAKSLIRLQAATPADGVELLRKYQENHVELTLNLKAPLTPDESVMLRSQPNLISLKTEINVAGDTSYKVSNKNKSASQLFSEYYKSRYGTEVSSELLATFLSLTEEE